MFEFGVLSCRRARMAVAGVALLASLAPAPVRADDFCRTAPEPGCLLNMAHDEVAGVANLSRRLGVLTRIAVAEAHAGYIDVARATFDESSRIADSGELFASQPPPSTTGGTVVSPDLGERALRQDGLIAIVAAKARAGWPVSDILMETPREANARGLASNHIMLVPALIESNRTDEARRALVELEAMLDRMGDPEFRTFGIVMIASSYVDLGDFDEALAEYDRGGLPRASYNYLNLLARVHQEQIKDGNSRAASAILQRYRETLENISNPQERMIGERILASIQPATPEDRTEMRGAAPLGNTGGRCSPDFSAGSFAAVQAELGFIGLALDTAMAIAGQQERDMALLRVAQIQERTGDMDGALATARLIDEEGLRDPLLATMSAIRADAGDSAAALAIAAEIGNEDSRAMAYGALPGRLLSAGNPGGAMDVAAALPDAAMRSEAYLTVAMALIVEQETPR